LGNVLCSYFHKLGISILEKKEFKYDENKYKSIPFFEKLPTTLPYSYDNIYNELTAYGITRDNVRELVSNGNESWVIKNNSVYHFWKCLKPLVHFIMDDAFNASDLVKTVLYPVIHFRCADTPFIKHPVYKLQKYIFFKEALEKIKSQGIMDGNTIYLMNCSTHYSSEQQQKACKEYTNSLNEYLTSIGYTCEVICNSNIDDLATLFYAPAVISTSSSYSFMPGFFGKGLFLSTEHDDDKCHLCDSWMLPGYNLQHTEVNDYLDYEKVITQLK
jgi:hypothetical protein